MCCEILVELGGVDRSATGNRGRHRHQSAAVGLGSVTGDQRRAAWMRHPDHGTDHHGSGSRHAIAQPAARRAAGPGGRQDGRLGGQHLAKAAHEVTPADQRPGFFRTQAIAGPVQFLPGRSQLLGVKQQIDGDLSLALIERAIRQRSDWRLWDRILEPVAAPLTDSCSPPSVFRCPQQRPQFSRDRLARPKNPGTDRPDRTVHRCSNILVTHAFDFA